MKRKAWLTGDGVGTGYICRTLRIPNDITVMSALNGALVILGDENNWEQFGTMSPQEMAKIFNTIIDEYFKSEGCMLGTIVTYITQNPPTHVLPCDGGTYNRADYPLLYDVLDPIFKGVDTFTLPDMNGRFLRGVDTSNPIGTQGGNEAVSLTVAQLPPHSHTSPPHAHTSPPHSHTEQGAIVMAGEIGAGIPFAYATAVPSVTGLASVSINPETVTINDTGNGEDVPIIPPFVAVKYGVWAR